VNANTNAAWADAAPLRDSMPHRTPRPYQLASLAAMRATHARAGSYHFVWLPTGTGKTLIVMMYAAFLRSVDRLPPYMVYAVPQSGAVTIIDQLHSYGFHVCILNKRDGVFMRGLPARYQRLRLADGEAPRRGTVTLVEHEQLKYFFDTLLTVAHASLVVVDEVHRMETVSLRAQTALCLARQSRECVVMTATPIIGNKVASLLPWLRQLVAFEVTVRNFWTAANAVIAHHVSTGVERRYTYVKADFSDAEYAVYRALVPPVLGGTARDMDATRTLRARALSRDVATRRMVQLVKVHLGAAHVPDEESASSAAASSSSSSSSSASSSSSSSSSASSSAAAEVPVSIQVDTKRNGAMIVAQDRAHQLQVYHLLCTNTNDGAGAGAGDAVSAGDILRLGVDKSSVNLNDDSVREPDVELRERDWRVVVVTQDQSSGYELSRLNAMFTSVYPSNQATRDQLHGRIDRLSQRARAVSYTVVHAGILTNSMDKHESAAALARALDQLPRNI
jgi:hypothetical protein